MMALPATPGFDHAGLLSGLARLVPRPRPTELRIDVQRDPKGLQAELDAIERRMRRKGDALHGLPALDIRRPGFLFLHREADGEHYVYVEDVARGRLAGYTVFNRLVEVDRRADRHLRAPHSRYAPDHQRCGLATAVYEWWRAGGRSLIPGARQSPAAYALWLSLARRHELFYVSLEKRKLRYLGLEVDEITRGDLHTRMILVGCGLDRARLAERVGIPTPAPSSRASPRSS
jgi:hypothetical protein